MERATPRPEVHCNGNAVAPQDDAQWDPSVLGELLELRPGEEISFLKQGMTCYRNVDGSWRPDLPRDPSGVFKAFARTQQVAASPPSNSSMPTADEMSNPTRSASGSSGASGDGAAKSPVSRETTTTIYHRSRAPGSAGCVVTQEILFSGVAMSDKDAQKTRRQIGICMLASVLTQTTEASIGTIYQEQEEPPVLKRNVYNLLHKLFPDLVKVNKKGGGSLTKLNSEGTVEITAGEIGKCFGALFEEVVPEGTAAENIQERQVFKGCKRSVVTTDANGQTTRKQEPCWVGVRFYDLSGDSDNAMCSAALNEPLLRMISGDLSVAQQMDVIKEAAASHAGTQSYKACQEDRKVKFAKAIHQRRFGIAAAGSSGDPSLRVRNVNSSNGQDEHGEDSVYRRYMQQVDGYVRCSRQ